MATRAHATKQGSAHARTASKSHASVENATKAGAKKGDGDGEESTASGHALWTGSISFGLVQIPVRMRAAERTKELSFHQLDKHDHSRIRYDRVNEKTGKKVEWGDIVKGFEISRGNYVIVDDEDFEKANVEATHTIDIQDFVERADIPVEHFERPYYLVPEKNGKRAYGVLRDALSSKGLVAIALVVIRTKQHLAAIMPEGDGLALVLMRFANEIVPFASLSSELPHETKATPQELKLAEQLVDTLTAKWDASKYVDTYARDLRAALEEKAEKGTITVREAERGAAPAGVVDLVALLRESVAKGGVRKASHKKNGREHAA